MFSGIRKPWGYECLDGMAERERQRLGSDVRSSERKYFGLMMSDLGVGLLSLSQ